VEPKNQAFLLTVQVLWKRGTAVPREDVGKGGPMLKRGGAPRVVGGHPAKKNPGEREGGDQKRREGSFREKKKNRRLWGPEGGRGPLS